VEAGRGVVWDTVSPDGRWVAFGLHEDRVNVYDAETGRRVWRSPAEQHNYCRFSPDGRWLVTDVDGGRLYAAGTWEPGPQLGPGTPWDVTSDLAVVGQPNGIYRLVELASGRELARLEDPEQNAGQAALTPDGSKLVVAARNGLRVWDLRRLRGELAKLGLDWEGPPDLSAGQPGDLTPLQVTPDLGELPPESAHRTILKYSLAIALQPVNSEAYLRRGRAYYELEDWTRAADDLGTALALNPANQDWRAWYELGYACAYSAGPRPAHARYSRPQQGIAAYSRAIALNPNVPSAWNNRAAYYEDVGELDKAVAGFSRAVALDPRTVLYWDNRARLHARLGRWAKVVEDCHGLLALVSDRERARVYALRARAYHRLGRYGEALSDYRQAVDQGPPDARCCDSLARLLATCPDPRLREPARAVELARKATELAPQEAPYWNTLGAAQYRAGHWKAAIEALTRALELRKGGDAGDGFFLALAHARLGNAEEARRWYDRAARWGEENRQALSKDAPKQEELRRLHAEATELLGPSGGP
jgi:tetratricopeptide (TPR) repeat protein